MNFDYEFHVKIAFRKKKNDKNCWPIIGKESLLKTGLSVIESIRNLKTHFFSGMMNVCQISWSFFTVI